MRKLILVLVASIFLNGCSFLPKFTMNRTVGTLPQKNESSEKNEKCSGELKKDEKGRTVSCSKGYIVTEKSKNMTERKFTMFEHIGNFFSALKGWFGLLVVLSIIGIGMGAGGLVATIWHNFFGTTIKALRALGRGINLGKKYVRSNGTIFTDAERKIYNQGADDLLKAIDDAIDDKNVEKLIYQIRAEEKWIKH